MKKLSKKRRILLKRRQISKYKWEIRRSNFLNQAVKKFGKTYDEYAQIIRNYQQERYKFKKRLYRNYAYDGKPVLVQIEGDFGIEDRGSVAYFLDKASEVIDFNSRELTIDLSKCTRIWPSGVTLLCSLLKWVELATQQRSHKPKILVIPSTDVRVDSYLYHSGFYKYFNVERIITDSIYKESEVVKIRRELEKQNIEKRELELIDLLIKFTNYTEEQIEWLDSAILTEILANVTEHGVSYIDGGWWILAQHHETHGLISLSIADNGIGVRHSLMTGPQKKQLKKKIKNFAENDGDFLRLAVQENVSGAIRASIKRGIILKRYPVGARRGHGLRWITDTCKKLEIELSILSHHGYYGLSKTGEEIFCGSKKRRVFAGTLYHLIIPTSFGG